MEIRTGIGYDIHRLVRARKLILGGVEIPYKKGLLGHSDADVLMHAITDGYVVNNIDTIIIAEEPKLSAFKKIIQSSIARTLKICPDKVAIKAKTNEGLGELGKKKAIACFACVTLSRRE
ncbi:MAG: 2-C-methyl-D-erythritol 2,4-cyclodiphosphate synthase [Candidatus Omnitrophica bacterium]|nr:2-C-methyl-D-erythritol 2,4-cyclodiphosphate synthase [Candidatus Omnitrophota bacterium]